jgi:hypothetical protein
MTVQEKIAKAVNEAKNFPNPTIHYNFDLPEGADFGGYKAVFNSMVPKDPGYSVTYKY